MITLNFTDIWNASVITEQRPLVARDYCWASELYRPTIDRYLAMKAVAPTNPPNIRSLRKFFAGNTWEFIAGLVLYQLGIIQEKQQEVWVEDAAIRIKGKIDYLIGGVPNYDKARDYISKLPFQKEMNDRFMLTIDKFEQSIGNNELKPLVYEIKSCSEYVIDKLMEGGNILGHDLQIYHYLRGLNMDEGHIVYCSKNDALMAERVIKMPDHSLKHKYEGDLLTLKGYLDANELPPNAPLIVWEGKFQKNFEVEYSNYLSLVYGFKTPEEFRETVVPKVQRWNRVLGRLKDISEGKRGKPTKAEPLGKLMVLTDKNRAAIEEMQNEGHEPKELAKQLRVIEEEDEE